MEPVQIYHILHTLFHVYWKKIYLTKKICFDFPSNFGEAFLVLRRNQRDNTILTQTGSYKVIVIFIRS